MQLTLDIITQLRIIREEVFKIGARPSKVKKAIYERRYAAFTELLQEERKKAGLTQAELAKKLRRPQSYVSKYERGERRLDVIEFLEIAGAINFDSNAFLQKLE